jgi:glycosyltransferase involved in cell wall biosynthesis
LSNTLLLFIENYEGGGSDRHLVDIINALKDDYENIFLVSNPPGLFAHDLKRLQRTIKTKQFKLFTRVRLFQMIGALPRLIRMAIITILFPFMPIAFLYHFLLCFFLLKSLKPTMVIGCNGGYPSAQMTLLIVIVSKLLSIPTALSIVSIPHQRRRHLFFYERFLDTIVWKSSDRIIVNAQAISKELQTFRGAPSEKVSVVYNAIEDRQSESGCSNVQKKELIIGFLARMDFQKGCIEFFNVFSNLARRYTQIRLVMAGGEGNASGQLNVLLETSELKDRIERIGYYDGDVHALLSTFDIYVLPSHREGLPYSILEAMRAECAIVSTEAGGIPEVIRSGIDGLLVRPRSMNDLERAIETLITDDEFRKTLKVNARQRFLKMFSMDAMNRKIKELLKPT